MRNSPTICQRKMCKCNYYVQQMNGWTPSYTVRRFYGFFGTENFVTYQQKLLHIITFGSDHQLILNVENIVETVEKLVRIGF